MHGHHKSAIFPPTKARSRTLWTLLIAWNLSCRTSPFHYFRSSFLSPPPFAPSILTSSTLATQKNHLCKWPPITPILIHHLGVAAPGHVSLAKICCIRLLLYVTLLFPPFLIFIFPRSISRVTSCICLRVFSPESSLFRKKFCEIHEKEGTRDVSECSEEVFPSNFLQFCYLNFLIFPGNGGEESWDLSDTLTIRTEN